MSREKRERWANPFKSSKELRESMALGLKGHGYLAWLAALGVVAVGGAIFMGVNINLIGIGIILYGSSLLFKTVLEFMRGHNKLLDMAHAENVAAHDNLGNYHAMRGSKQITSRN